MQILVLIAFSCNGVHQHQIVFKRGRRCDHVSRRIHGEAAAIEDQMIVAAHLIHIGHRDLVPLCRGLKQFAPQFAFPHVIGRSVDADQDLRARLNQFFHRIALIERPFPELFIVPRIFANSHRDSRAAQRADGLLVGWKEVASLVEDVVGGQQHLVLPEDDLSALDNGGTVHRLFARAHSRAADVSGDDGEVEIRRRGCQFVQTPRGAHQETFLLH